MFDLEMLCNQLKQSVPTVITKAYPEYNQIIVGFSNRPDVEIALLTPYFQRKAKMGNLNNSDIDELIASVRRISDAQLSK